MARISLESLLQGHPKTPQILARTLASKLSQEIKKLIADPIFKKEAVQREIASWPKPLASTLEWFAHAASGATKSIPDDNDFLRTLILEAVSDTFHQIGVQLADVPEEVQRALAVSAIPMVRNGLVWEMRKGPESKTILQKLLGTSEEFHIAFDHSTESMRIRRRSIRDRRAAKSARPNWKKVLGVR